jgi:hypothetical protein
MEIPEIRRRVRTAIDQARRDTAERRARSDAAARDYELFLAQQAVPAFHQFASALQGEGLRFRIDTPADSVRLSADGMPGDFLEIGLDREANPPVAEGRVSHGRGRRAVSYTRPVRAGAAISELTADDVIEFLVAEIPGLVQR